MNTERYNNVYVGWWARDTESVYFRRSFSRRIYFSFTGNLGGVHFVEGKGKKGKFRPITGHRAQTE